MNYAGVNMITCGSENCYVIRGRDGDILIDTGSSRYREEIGVWLDNYNIKLIFLTHGHNDHIGNAAFFAKRFGADIAMSAYDIALARNNKIHKLYRTGARGFVIMAASKMTFLSKSESFETNIFLEDGLPIGDICGIEDCTAVRLEGHTKGSFGILHGNDLYVGDAAMNFVSPSFPAICESPRAARETLNFIRQLMPDRVFFGHGSPVMGGSPEYNKMFDMTIF
ncbi:MAG: MBL fold metallo-hydrolase [Oscillospiraceae bacterium]|nr:MBL fold metallo-hydrolase [Oscillospiraceae bacterium]